MKSFEYVIRDEIGIHARPAGQIVKEAKKYQSIITIRCNGKEAGATKLMALLGLAVKNGMKVKVSAEGEDEDIAAAGLQKFFEQNV
ncbi:HPr family phosphocarrier protein [Caproiciproducens sp.]|uniref:HPr family phosphocarrier protein n=1 Tax=Caproiciproducens sp. TaxID=1954376 RepID=UPI00289FB7C7|nr:HPr family phosphocarrier protein [Caproiciproducens sp.]